MQITFLVTSPDCATSEFTTTLEPAQVQSLTDLYPGTPWAELFFKAASREIARECTRRHEALYKK